jgi:hypothetical protein
MHNLQPVCLSLVHSLDSFDVFDVFNFNTFDL